MADIFITGRTPLEIAIECAEKLGCGVFAQTCNKEILKGTKTAEAPKTAAEIRALHDKAKKAGRSKTGYIHDCLGLSHADDVRVLDADDEEGAESFAKLFPEGDPETLTIKTPHGKHAYFRCPPGLPDGNIPGFKKLECKKRVTAPGTKNYEGGEYEIVKNVPLMQMPENVVRLAKQIRARTETATILSTIVTLIPEGQRQTELTRIVGRLRRDGLDIEELEAAALAVNRRRCRPPLSDAEVKGVCRSIGSKPSKEEAKAAPKVKTAAELLITVFAPLVFWVERLLVSGLTILAGSPKIGKSWLLLQLATALINGAYFMGKLICQPCEVLALFLEDTDRRIQARLKKQKVTAVDGLHYATEWPQGQAGIDALEIFLMEHPAVRVVLIDTWGCFYPLPGENDSYTEAGTILRAIKGVADRRDVAILVTHHTRKMWSSDFLDSILGSKGIPGAVDTGIVIERARFQSGAVLKLTSRDIEEAEYALTFDPDVGTWTLEGEAKERQKTAQRQELYDLLAASPEAMSPVQVYRALRDRGDKRTPSTIKKILWEMNRDGVLMSLSGFYCVVNRKPDKPENKEGV